MIEIVGLVKRYGTDTAVNGLSFRVERGEVVGLLGPNGSGKTTTINVLSTLIAPDEGTVSVCGRDVVADPSGVRELISLLRMISRWKLCEM